MAMGTDIDVEKLFENHSVEEVKIILRKIRNDIERKKEDLRVMVGERYRDLIDAADTIENMEKSAVGVCDEVAAVQKLCSSLQHRGLVGFKTTPTQKLKAPISESSENSIAAKVKIIVMCNMRVWKCLEKCEILNATLLYFLAQHTHTALTLSQPASKISLSVRFPVLARQWVNVSLLPETIQRICNHTITANRKIDDMFIEKISEAVISLLLLQRKTLSSTLDGILMLLQSSLLESLVNYTPQQTARPIITLFCHRLLKSLIILQRVFCKDAQAVNVIDTLITSVTCEKDANFIKPVKLLGESESYLALLPHSIHTFKPHVSDCQLSHKQFTDKITVWLDDLSGLAKKSLASILSYCPSIQSMCAVRQSVWSVIAKLPSNWPEMKSSLGLPLSWCVWDNIVRECFINRGKEIIAQELGKATDNTFADVSQLTQQIKTNHKTCMEEGSGIVRYVWSETSGDLPDKVGWLSASQRTLLQAGGLAYKSSGYTNRTQTICNTLNTSLNSLRTDVENMYSEEESSSSVKEDYICLLTALQTQSCLKFKNLVQSILSIASEESNKTDTTKIDATSCLWPYGNADNTLGLIGGGLEGDTGDTRHSLQASQTVLVLLARLCHALCHICPNMQLCAIATALINPDTVRRVSLALSVETPIDPQNSWCAVEAELSSANLSLLNTFLSTLTDTLHSNIQLQFSTALSCDTNMSQLYAMALCESVDSEDSSTSKLSVPYQISPVLSDALHALCKGLNATTLHTLNRNFSSSIPHAVCSTLVKTYSSVVRDKLENINSQLALHLIFDMKFIADTLLPADDKTLSSSLSDTQMALESVIDPFDLTVLQSHLNVRVRNAANREQIILGALYVRGRHHPLNKSASTGNSSLPLVPVMDIPRFSNVPLPKTITPSLHSMPSESTHSPPKQISSSPSTPVPSSLQPLNSSSSSQSKTASSIFSAMSSSWFGGAAYK